jgi:integrase
LSPQVTLSPAFDCEVRPVLKFEMPKKVQRWVLFEYVDGEIAFLSKPFNTKQLAEKARLKYPERERKKIGVGVVRIGAAKHLNSRKQTIDDTFMVLLLRWTGLRASDATNLRWDNIHFGRGVNGEVDVLTQKRGKVAIIPLSTELRTALEQVSHERKPHGEDRVLFNPETGSPYSSRVRLSEGVKALCRRAGVKGTAHCFRDTFACDSLARGIGVYEVAQMLADTVDTVEKHYAQFVPAARDAAQTKMDSGIGIEERAGISGQRGRKVVGIRRGDSASAVRQRG